MGRPFFEYLDDGDSKVYACKACKCNLAKAEELVSKAFHSKNGRAYLFNNAVNVSTGPSEERMMTTGMHVVCDVFCSKCRSTVGWKYEYAHEKSQKYKEGKVILERALVVDLERAESSEGDVDLFDESESDDGSY